MKIEIISVTPALAEQWLATNTDHNRRLSAKTVKRYAQDMIKGKWLITGETIKFDRDGRLIDGQHRLSAIIAAHKTVKIAVVRDLDADTMLVIDTGKTRSGGDSLAINGHNGYSDAMAALARKIIAFQGGATPIVSGKGGIKLRGETITNREIVEYCNQHDITEHIRFAWRIKNTQVTEALNYGEYAFFHWYFSRVDSAAAEIFLNKLATLEDVSADSPIRALLQKLTRSITRLDGKMKMHAVVTAWNAWRTGEKLTIIHVGRLENEPAIPVAV